MKEYMVRLMDYKGSVIDGDFYKAANMGQAKKCMKSVCKTSGLLNARTIPLKFRDIIKKFGGILV